MGRALSALLVLLFASSNCGFTVDLTLQGNDAELDKIGYETLSMKDRCTSIGLGAF